MGSEKVQFQTNIPVEVALKYSDGKDVTGQYGDQVLYTLTDGRVMYVPPIVKKKIEEAGIARGELLTITKAERENGTSRTIESVVAAECLEFFRKALGEHLQEVALQKGEHAMEFLELGEAMIQKYLAEAAPLIQPAAVESRVSGVIGGVKSPVTLTFWIAKDESSIPKARSGLLWG